MWFRKIPLLAWIGAATAVIIGVGVWFFTINPAVLGEKTDSDKPVPVAQPVNGTQEFDIVGRDHISSGTAGSGYNSNPPTSGPHWPNPAKNGVYDKQFPDEQIIHDLEHGYVWVSYKPDASDEVKNKLKEIVEKDDWKVILEPRDKNEKMIALAAWGRVLNLESANYGIVEEFIKTYRNRGPEKTPD